MSSLLVSAPGKVILFGEHSAVYHKPAIAAALGLRAYLLVSELSDPSTISLELPDIGLAHCWNIADIPWNLLAQYIPRIGLKPIVTEELTPQVIDALRSLWSQLEGPLHQTAAMCFLYLYVHLCSPEIPSNQYIVRLTLPIGAGLGSLAAISVCLASALLFLGGHLDSPTHDKDDLSTTHVSSEFIDQWSLMGEKCFHGNPSGIDNAVSTYGGAVLYQKALNPQEPALRVNLTEFPPLQLLLTNTKMPRSTAALVSGVAERNTAHPAITGLILNAMSHVASEAHITLLSKPFDESVRAKIRELANINHGLLAAIGVSHPALEKIKVIADTHGIGATKLTGAGGGGCAITLINENAAPSAIENASRELQQQGFDTFSSSLGCKGAGCIVGDTVSVAQFKGYKDRFEVDAAIGVDSLKQWRFW